MTSQLIGATCTFADHVGRLCPCLPVRHLIVVDADQPMLGLAACRAHYRLARAVGVVIGDHVWDPATCADPSAPWRAEVDRCAIPAPAPSSSP